MIRGSPNPKARAVEARQMAHQRPTLLGSNTPASAVQGAAATRSTRTKASVSGHHATTSAGRFSDAAARANSDNQVVAFLKQCGLQMYAARMLQHGFDEMETLQVIDDADMRDLGMPPYHVMRLRKSLKELQQRDGVASAEGGRSVVVAFLEEHGLEQYASALLSSGFDEMETLLDVDDLDLKDLGMPRGHALKLKRHLRNYEINSYATDYQPVVAVEPVERKPVVARTAQARASVPPRSASHALEASDSMKGDVEKSWESIQRLGTDVVGERIYRCFFELVPDAMENFPAEVRKKYSDWTAEESEDESNLNNSLALRRLFGKVLNALGCVVAGLQDSSKLVPLLTSLGGRHIAYGPGGVNEAFWPALGKAINMTLSDLLGEGFTSEVENAWNVVFGFASSIMIAGMRQAIAASQQMQRKEKEGSVAKWSHMSQASHDTADDRSTHSQSEDHSWQREFSD